MNAVVVEDLTMRYRGHTALDGVDLTLAPDTIHGLLGRNGAGKTTLMRILTGQEFGPPAGSRCSGSRRGRTRRC